MPCVLTFPTCFLLTWAGSVLKRGTALQKVFHNQPGLEQNIALDEQLFLWQEAHLKAILAAVNHEFHELDLRMGKKGQQVGFKSLVGVMACKEMAQEVLRWVSLSSSVQALSMNWWQNLLLGVVSSCSASAGHLLWQWWLQKHVLLVRPRGRKWEIPNVSAKKKNPESFDLKLLWVSLYLAYSCSLEDFWRSSRIQSWWKPPSDFQATSPVGLNVCGDSSGCGAGTAVSLTAWTSS